MNYYKGRDWSSTDDMWPEQPAKPKEQKGTVTIKLLIVITLLGLLISMGYRGYKYLSRPLEIVEDTGCPIWICTPPPDARSVEQYVAECNPKPARYLDSEVYSYWCSNNINPIDKSSQKPNDWNWQ